MISRLRGTVREIHETQILLEVNGIGYEVLVAPSILQAIQDRLDGGGEIEIVTFHYQQLEVGRGIPVLIGFLNDIEREFFVKFISVSGVGPRAALRALTQPIPVIAQAIDQADLTMLRSLPGIGAQRAKEIVAKLQGKVGKFALIQTQGVVAERAETRPAAGDIAEEAAAVLVQLEYKRPEALQMVRTALARNPQLKTVEELLNEVYHQRQSAAVPEAPPRQAEPEGAKRRGVRRAEALP